MGVLACEAQYARAAIVSRGLWSFLITSKEKVMRNLSMLVFILTSLTASLASAAGAKIDITSPADGSRLNARAQSKLDYEVTPRSEEHTSELQSPKDLV